MSLSFSVCVYVTMSTAICLMGAVWKHLIGQSAWIERGLMGRVMCRTALRHTNTHCQLKCDSLRHTKTKGLSWHCRKSPCTHQKKKKTYFAQQSSIIVAVKRTAVNFRQKFHIGCIMWKELANQNRVFQCNIQQEIPHKFYKNWIYELKKQHKTTHFSNLT